MRRFRPWARAMIAVASLFFALSTTPGRLAAQLPIADAAFQGAAQNGLAFARGYAAVALNPANLGLRDNPGFSLSVLAGTLEDGLQPIGLLDLYGSGTVSDAERIGWLDAIAASGGQRGSGGADLSYVAMSSGPFALQLSTASTAAVGLDPDGAELLMFGNGGLTGEARALQPEVASAELFRYTTVALSFGYRIVPDGAAAFFDDSRLTLGATFKYTFGQELLVAMNSGSASDGGTAVSVLVPALRSASQNGFLDGGGGVGLDVGLAWEGGPIVLSVVGRNLVNLFEWRPEGLAFRPNTLTLGGAGFASRTDDEDLSGAPEALVELVEDLRFAPEIGAGFGIRLMDGLSVSGDLRRRLLDGMGVAPPEHLGGSVEYAPPIPLVQAVRAGAASVSGGYQAGGGITLGWGFASLSLAYLSRSADHFDGALASFSLSVVR